MWPTFNLAPAHLPPVLLFLIHSAPDMPPSCCFSTVSLCTCCSFFLQQSFFKYQCDLLSHFSHISVQISPPQKGFPQSLNLNYFPPCFPYSLICFSSCNFKYQPYYISGPFWLVYYLSHFTIRSVRVETCLTPSTVLASQQILGICLLNE